MKDVTLNTSQSRHESAIPAFLQTIGRYVKTHFKFYSRPEVFVAERGNYKAAGIINPVTFFVWNFVIFISVASVIPLFSESTPEINVRKLLLGTITFIKNNDSRDIFFKCLFPFITLVGLLTIPLFLFFGGSKTKLKEMSALSSYFLVALFDFAIFRFGFGLLIIKASYSTNRATEFLTSSFLGFGVVDIIACGLGYPVICIAICLIRAIGSKAILFVICFLSVVFGNAYYFNKAVSSQANPIAQKSQKPSSSKKLATVVDSTYVAPVAHDDTVSIVEPPIQIAPDNFDIELSSNPASHSVIHFSADKKGEKYWLKTSFTLTNTTSVQVNLNPKGLALVHLSIGEQALRFLKKKTSKDFLFKVVLPKGESTVLEGNSSKVIPIKIQINEFTYNYIKLECSKVVWDPLKVFIEIIMFDQTRAFPVNRQANWDINFVGDNLFFPQSYE